MITILEADMKVVTISGSMRFAEEMKRIAADEVKNAVDSENDIKNQQKLREYYESLPIYKKLNSKSKTDE